MTAPDSSREPNDESELHDERFLRAFRRSLALKTSVSVLVMGVVIALISIVPLYSLLEEHELDSLHFTAVTRQMTVEEYLSKARETAVLVTSRSQIREDLEQYNHGGLSLAELIARARPKMLDAISGSEFVVGVSRFSATHKFVFEAGISIPEQYRLLPSANDPRVLMRGPFRIAGQSYVVVGAAIVNRQGVRVGADAILMSTESLQHVVADRSSLGETGRVVLGRSRNGRTETFFATPAGESRSSAEESRGAQDLDRLFTFAVGEQRSGVRSSSLDGIACVAVGFKEIDWSLVITKEESELHGALQQQLGLISAIILALMLIGVLSAVWTLRPLERMVASHSDRLREQLNLTQAALDKGTVAERALLRERERLQVTLHSISDAVIATDNHAQISMLNRAAEELLGITSEEAKERPFLSLSALHPDDDAPAIDLAREILSRGSTVSLPAPHSLTTQDGRELHVQARGAPILGERGKELGAVMVITDVTRRHELELQLRQAQKLEAIGQLTGGIAHDFNNILTAILGHGEMALADMPLGIEQREDVEAMHAAGLRAAALTRQLLAFSRKQTLNVRALDLNEVVDGLVEMLRRLLPDNVELNFTASSEPATLRADGGQMEQVITNMVVNARDAMPRGGQIQIRISHVELDQEYVEFHSKAKPGPHILISISDTGTGMPPSVIERIFEPFFTTKAVGKGTGLGLSTSLGIIEQHGGHVDLESAVDAGTTFRVYLPAANEPAERSDAPGAGEMIQGSGTILVVDDDAVVLSLLCKSLRALGYKVLAALNGQAALEFASNLQGPIDLLLTDVSMPLIDGPTLSAALRETRPDMLVVYMSGNAQSQQVEGIRELQEGGAHLLSKPILPSLLSAKIHQLLADRPQVAGE